MLQYWRPTLSTFLSQIGRLAESEQHLVTTEDWKKLCQISHDLTEDNLDDLFFPDGKPTHNPVFLSGLSFEQREKIYKSLLNTEEGLIMPLINLHECLDEIRRHSLFCRDMMHHVAAWFRFEDSTHKKETQKPPLYKLFHPLFSLDEETKSVRMQTTILSYCIANSAAFREKSVSHLTKITTLKLDNYADRFKHPSWKELKIKVGKQSSVPFSHPSLASSDQSSSKSSPSLSSNPSRDIVSCMLMSLSNIVDTSFGEFLLTKENLKNLRHTLSHAVLDMIVELSPQITAFSSSEQCKKATGYTLKQMKKLIKNCREKQKSTKSRAVPLSVISNLPVVAQSSPEDLEISK
jgi:hypothetical protein